MVVDHLSNATLYFSLHPLFKKAFEFLKTLDMKQVEIGTTQLEGDALKVSVTKAKMKTKAEAKLEHIRNTLIFKSPLNKRNFWVAIVDEFEKFVNGYDVTNDIELTMSPRPISLFYRVSLQFSFQMMHMLLLSAKTIQKSS